MRTAGQRRGDAAEALVAERLAAAGWSVVARQLRVGRAELDILAVDPGPPRELVVVEVRWRGSRGFGLPEETVDRRKRRRLIQAGSAVLAGERARLGIPVVAGLRLDLVAVEPGTGEGSPLRIRHHRAVPLG
jgi:putative endonuclease